MITGISTITLTSPYHGLSVKDKICISMPDKNKWRRLWHFITFRSAPLKHVYFEIVCVTGSIIEVKQ